MASPSCGSLCMQMVRNLTVLCQGIGILNPPIPKSTAKPAPKPAPKGKHVQFFRGGGGGTQTPFDVGHGAQMERTITTVIRKIGKTTVRQGPRAWTRPGFPMVLQGFPISQKNSRRRGQLEGGGGGLIKAKGGLIEASCTRAKKCGAARHDTRHAKGEGGGGEHVVARRRVGFVARHCYMLLRTQRFVESC